MLKEGLLATEHEPLLSEPRHSVRDASDLPDLTARLQEQGVYGEYVAWRDQYMRWRKGDARGAKGENTVRDHVKRSSEFQTWYPTVKTFTFRRTISFWGSVFCCEGCLLFLWIDMMTTYTIGTPEMLYELTKVPNLLGGTFFLSGIYLAWFELINLDSERINESTYNYLWCDLEDVTKRGISQLSFFGAAIYLIGALFYTCAQVSDFFELDPTWKERLVDWPYIIGGFLFFVSGCLEMIINNVFTSPPTAYVWWVAVMNGYGGLTFWLSACPSVFEGEAATIVGVSGTVTYLVGAVMGLLMWRGEQFGGAMIPALNRLGHVAVRADPTSHNGQLVVEVKEQDKAKAQDALNPRLSWRGLVFLIVYIFIGAFQILASCTCLNHHMDYRDDPERFRRFLNVFVTSFVNVCIVHMVLALNSVTVTMPKRGDEPFRSLVILMRVLSLIVLVNSVLTLEVQFEDAEKYPPSSI